MVLSMMTTYISKKVGQSSENNENWTHAWSATSFSPTTRRCSLISPQRLWSFYFFHVPSWCLVLGVGSSCFWFFLVFFMFFYFFLFSSKKEPKTAKTWKRIESKILPTYLNLFHINMINVTRWMLHVAERKGRLVDLTWFFELERFELTKLEALILQISDLTIGRQLSFQVIQLSNSFLIFLFARTQKEKELG